MFNNYVMKIEPFMRQ